MGRKSRLFACSISSPDPEFADVEVEFAESLRPCPRIFPFCGDYRRRPVRSRLPPEHGTRFRAIQHPCGDPRSCGEPLWIFNPTFGRMQVCLFR
jgi:hypothetical protein